MSTEHNPYQAPAAMDLHARRTADRGPAKSQLRPPAVALITLSLAAMVLDLIVFWNFVTSDAPKIMREEGPESGRGQIVASLVANGGLFLIHAFVMYGSVTMVRGGPYRHAVAAATVSLFPFCSPVVLLGIPFAIWALVVLRRTEVKEFFRGATASTPAVPPPEPIPG